MHTQQTNNVKTGPGNAQGPKQARCVFPRVKTSVKAGRGLTFGGGSVAEDQEIYRVAEDQEIYR